MQHVEFFHTEHFERNYHRVKPPESLAAFIDFFWETDFDALLEQYPAGFSDALFPNIGYTYLFNLGTPFTMQVGEKKFEMKTDGFLPRNTSIECYHRKGNRLFGIKFRISPVIFTKKVNFGEYRAFIYPLSYLMEASVVNAAKEAANFEKRVQLLSGYFESIVKDYAGSLEPIRIVSAIIGHCDTHHDFTTSMESFAVQHGISARTLHRYFEANTSLSGKKALQILRIRKAAAHLSATPGTFHFSLYGYYDYSHFFKHLKNFLQKDTIRQLKPHLVLLSKLRK